MVRHPRAVREQFRKVFVELQVVRHDHRERRGHRFFDVQRRKRGTKPFLRSLRAEECKPGGCGIRARGRPFQQVVEIADRVVRYRLRQPFRERPRLTKERVQRGIIHSLSHVPSSTGRSIRPKRPKLMLQLLNRQCCTPTSFIDSSFARSNPPTAPFRALRSTPLPDALTTNRSPSTTVNSLRPPCF